MTQETIITKTRDPNGDWRVEGSRLGAIAECPGCGAEVKLMQDVEAWEPDTGEIVDWGPSTGVCETCYYLIVDSWDGTKTYDLSKEIKGEPQTMPQDFTEQERQVCDYVIANPKALIIDVSARFDISPDEAERIIKSIRDKIQGKEQGE
jgi:hypothetical protein